jgi:hypothetical protein
MPIGDAPRRRFIRDERLLGGGGVVYDQLPVRAA